MQNQRALLAVEGWLELGNLGAAIEELHDAPTAIKSSLDVLRLWVVIYARKQRWTEVERIYEGLASAFLTGVSAFQWNQF